MLKFFIIHA